MGYQNAEAWVVGIIALAVLLAYFAELRGERLEEKKLLLSRKARARRERAFRLMKERFLEGKEK